MRNPLASHKDFPDLKPGTKIKIIEMVEEPQYAGKVGEVQYFDHMGQCHGTWGIALQARDSYVILTDAEYEKEKKA